MVQRPDFLVNVGKETNPSIAISSIFTETSLVLSRMEPALEDSMSILAHVSSSTRTLAEIRTRDTAVMELPGIPSSSIFTRMNKWAFSPVMRICSRTWADLE